MSDLLLALNRLFWKLPPPGGYPKDAASVASFWVAELRDAGIEVMWDAQAEEFREP